MTTEQENIVKEALESETFSVYIEESVPTQVRLDTDLKTEMKEVGDQFLEFMFKSDPEMQSIANMNRKERTDEQTEKLKTFSKNAKKKFRSILKFSHPKPGKDPLAGLVEKLVHTAQILKYIGKDDIESRIKNLGLDITIPPLEETNPSFNNEDTKTLMTDIFAQAGAVADKIDDAEGSIEENYLHLDSSVSYDPDVNPEGITKSQFKKLVKTAAKRAEKPDKFSDFKDRMIKKDSAAIVSQEITLEKAKTL